MSGQVTVSMPGFIHKVLAGATLEDALAFANLAGAFSTTQEGGTEAFRDRASFEKLSQWNTGSP